MGFTEGLSGDGPAAAIWLTLNVCAFALVARFFRRVFLDETFAQTAMHAIVVLWSAVVAICVSLGAVGLLRWEAMGAAALLAAVAASLWLRRAETKAAVPAMNVARKRYTFGEAAWMALAALAGGLVVERLLGFPKHWDDLMYHLPLLDHWLQDGRLYVPGCAEWYNPGNGELVGLWCVAPFSGDFWVGLANLPIVALLAVATVEIGRQLDLDPVPRHAVAVAAVASNVVLTHLTDLENDTAVAATFAATLAYGSRHARHARRADLFLAAISLGLLAGVKYYALGYAAVAWTGLTGLILAARGRRAALGFVGASLAVSLPLAGYWYLRNWLVTGTPFFPLGFSDATDVLESVRPSAAGTTFFGNGRADLWVQYVAALRQLTGICQVAAVLLLPATFVWLLASAGLASRDGHDTHRAALRAALALLLLGVVAVFGVTPFTVSDDDERKINGAFTVVRYSQCGALVAMLALAVAFDDVRQLLAPARWKPSVRSALAALPGLALALAAAFQLAIQGGAVMGSDACLLSLNVGLAGWLARELWELASSRRWLAWPAAVAVLSFGVVASAWLSLRWHSGYAAQFDHQFVTRVFSRLERGEPDATRIAVADYRYYAFFGSRRQFRAHRPFRILSRKSLDEYLSDFQIDVLAVIRRDPFKYGRYRGVADWAANDTATFEKIDSGGGFDVYRVNKPPAKVAGRAPLGRVTRSGGAP